MSGIQSVILQERLKFTYEDYLKLPDDGKVYQIIDGEVFMAPAPTPNHQRIVLQMTIRLSAFVNEKGLGEVFIAPCDVVLSEENIVQPDILFVSSQRAHIIGERYISGPPDLVVEVLSPGTEKIDRVLKRGLYERYGVKELWFVSPERREIQVLRLVRGKFVEHGRFGVGETLISPLLPGLKFDIDEVFADR
ncbi:TPA: Uma2 family endonuclease [Candidatus Poribacteria bacterium]|nr:Uma2 family endonuclease [Candidatus Poribacteria bacterium]HEX29118.1 Uma2 family endonuclease [Candidatus Poribacteria bacterium]